MTAAGELDFVNHQILDYTGRTLEDLKQWATSDTVHPGDHAHVAKVSSESFVLGRPYDMVHRLHRIAHEVNQPLSGIITNAGTCLRMLDADPPNVEGARETARRTIRDGHRASEVITRLRALFAKREFTLESLDLNEPILEVIALSRSDLQRDRVVIQSELADNLPTVTGGRIQLQQLILNLLRNASDAMVDVHDRPRRLLIRTNREDDDRVHVSVRDAGVGIGAHTMNKLSDAFYTTKSDGMGIGLSISRSIIERHLAASGRSRTMDQEPRSGCRFLAMAKAWPSRRREGFEPIPRCYRRHRSHWRILYPGIGIRPPRQWDRAPVRMTPVDRRLAWLHVAVARYAAHTQWMPLDICTVGSR